MSTYIFLGSLSADNNIIIKSWHNATSFLVIHGTGPESAIFHYLNVGFQRVLLVVKLEISHLTLEAYGKTCSATFSSLLF